MSMNIGMSIRISIEYRILIRHYILRITYRSF